MRILKRLDSFVLKSFLPLFAMTFFIVLFIVLMQFLWKYIDDLVGKGFSLDLLCELFFYAAVSMIPMALPLAILLASLMTFGNFGEKFELTAMKASGISLVRVMLPLIIFIGGVSVGAFFFQNDVLPKAQVKMWTLLFSMRQKSPELEIPEDVFYDQIPGYNLFVKHKNTQTGMLYDVMIYDVSKGAENTTIMLCDSARLAFSKDLKYLYLHTFGGEQFENLRDQQMGDRNVPFRREEFKEKELLIPFDANFNRLDEEGMRKQYVGKNIKELRATIDSVGMRVDSMGRDYAFELKREAFPLLVSGVGRNSENSFSSSFENQDYETVAEQFDSVQNAREYTIGRNQRALKKNMEKSALLLYQDDAGKKVTPIYIDSLLSGLSSADLTRVFDNTASIRQRHLMETEFKSISMEDEKKSIRRHDIEMIKKFTLSFACLIMFFIGAPLGAIIRKGGIGTPLVISVLLFLVYYIIDNTGYKMARDGRWPVWIGMWMSTFILAPLGIYVTIKAMNDSAVFDRDRVVAFIRKALGRKPERIVRYKEVIIEDISSHNAIEILKSLKSEAADMLAAFKSLNYKSYFLQGYDTAAVTQLGENLERDIEELTNYPDAIVTNKLPDFPVIMSVWALRPAPRKWIGWILMTLFPIGLPLWLVGGREYKKLREELEKIISTSNVMLEAIENGMF